MESICQEGLEEGLTLFKFAFQLHMTEVTTISAEGIKNLLHHTFCIYNALSNVKAEVESVIKIGRRVVDSVDTEPSMKLHLTGKIDALKEEFNSTGKEVSKLL